MKLAKSKFSAGEEAESDTKKSKKKGKKTARARRTWSGTVPPTNIRASFPTSPNHTVIIDGFSMQGRRPYQEDRILIIPDLRAKALQIAHVRDLERVFVRAGASPPRRMALFSVVDGHAGFRAAEFVVGHVAETFWNAVCTLQEEEKQAAANIGLLNVNTCCGSEGRDDESGGGYASSACSFSGEKDGSSVVRNTNTIEMSRSAYAALGGRYPEQWQEDQDALGEDDVHVGRFVREVLKRTMMDLDRAWLKRVHGAQPKINDGACVLLCIMIDSKIHLAHVGDCRAVLYNASGRFQALTFDHKPGISKSEDRRVQDAGGEIQRGRGGAESRVCAAGTRISVTRAIGDANLKRSANPVLSSVPDTCTVDLKGKNCWSLVMASDGVWFRMGNATVSSFLRKSRSGTHDLSRTSNASRVPENEPTASVAELLVRESYRRGSFDNISAIVVTEMEIRT